MKAMSNVMDTVDDEEVHTADVEEVTVVVTVAMDTEAAEDTDVEATVVTMVGDTIATLIETAADMDAGMVHTVASAGKRMLFSDLGDSAVPFDQFTINPTTGLVFIPHQSGARLKHSSISICRDNDFSLAVFRPL